MILREKNEKIKEFYRMKSLELSNALGKEELKESRIF